MSFLCFFLFVLCFGTIGPYLCPWKPKHRSAMFSLIITFALAALAIWLLVDSAVEFIQEGQDDPLATEP